MTCTAHAGNRLPFDNPENDAVGRCVDSSSTRICACACGLVTPSGAQPAEEVGASEGGKKALLATGKERKNSMSLCTESEDEATMNEVSPSPFSSLLRYHYTSYFLTQAAKRKAKDDAEWQIATDDLRNEVSSSGRKLQSLISSVAVVEAELSLIPAIAEALSALDSIGQSSPPHSSIFGFLIQDSGGGGGSGSTKGIGSSGVGAGTGTGQQQQQQQRLSNSGQPGGLFGFLWKGDSQPATPPPKQPATTPRPSPPDAPASPPAAALMGPAAPGPPSTSLNLGLTQANSEARDSFGPLLNIPPAMSHYARMHKGRPRGGSANCTA